MYYASTRPRIIYFLRVRCILLSDRGLFYLAVHSKENAGSVVESFEHSVSPLLLVVR